MSAEQGRLPGLGLLRAEWQKVAKNFLLTSFLVWIYPVGFAAFFTIAVLMGLLSEATQNAMLTTSGGQWTTDVLGVWGLFTSFPNNILPRLLPLAFMAVVFAREYEWGMWKYLIPRSRRRPLILAKFVILIGVVTLSVLVSQIVVGAGQVLSHAAAGAAYGPALTSGMLAEFGRALARETLLGVTSLVILAGYAACAALVTRSILGGLLAGFGLSVLEPMSLVGLQLLGRILNLPGLVNLFQFTPTYNLENVRAWLAVGAAHTRVAASFTAEPSLLFSIVVLGVWVVGLIALAMAVFERQDIVS